MSLYACRTDGLAFIPVREGYVVDGGDRQEHITGKLARELFPALIPLLDGTRTVEEIADVLGLPLAHLRGVMALLAQRDLVRLRATPPREHRSPPMKTFLERSYPSGWAGGIWRRLQASNVAVACGQPLTDLLVGLLEESGCGLLGPGEGRPDLTITVMPGRAAPVLPIRVTSTAVSIGPLLQPGESAEYDAASGECDTALAGVAAGVIAGVALRMLGGHGGQEPVIDVLDSGGLVRVVERPAPGRAGRSEPCRHMARRHLTEPRLPLRRSSQPLVRTMSRILDDLDRAPAAGHAGAVRAYLLGDLHDGRRTYFVDPAAGALVELPGPVRHAYETPTLVLTHDVCAERRLLPGDTGLILAQLAGNADAAGWRVRAIDSCVQLDLDVGREQVAAVAELTPVRPRARPARRVRPRAECHFGDEPLDGARLTRVIVRALARAEEAFGDGRLDCAMYARKVKGTPFGSTRWMGEPDQPCDLDLSSLESHMRDRGLSPAALLLFTAYITNDRLRMKAAMAAATVRLLAADAGMGAVLFARLPEELPFGYGSDRRVLYGCALGSPSTELSGPVSSRVVW
jgi:hypothetical protein